jgi:hypothetical protein
VRFAALPLAATAALATVTSCASEASEASGDSARTAPYELIVGSDQDPWCDKEDEANADLRGAHFSLSLGCVFREPAVPEMLSDRKSYLAELPPAQDGTEFLLVQVADQAEYLPEHGTDPAWLSAWIQAGGERLELESVPKAGQFLVLSVPADETAVLWVDDDGRAQGLDLRSGERVEPLAPYYADIGFWTESATDVDFPDVEFESGAGGWTVGCHSSRIEFTRSMWLPDYGWAPEGSVYLRVDLWWCTGDGVYDELVWTLDETKAILVTSGSRTAEPVGWSKVDGTGRHRGQHHSAVVAVPADARDFQVAFSPVGELTEKDSGEVYSTTEPPPAAEWTVQF